MFGAYTQCTPLLLRALAEHISGAKISEYTAGQADFEAKIKRFWILQIQIWWQMHAGKRAISVVLSSMISGML